MSDWIEIEPGHWRSGADLHVIDGTAKDPCAKCKGNGRRGRGRCGGCYGHGETRRRYSGLPSDANGFRVTHGLCLPGTGRSHEAATRLAEACATPSEIWEFDPAGTGIDPYEQSVIKGYTERRLA